MTQCAAKTKGRQCENPAVEGGAYCDFHRCAAKTKEQERCKKRVIDGEKHCQVHYEQIRKRRRKVLVAAVSAIITGVLFILGFVANLTGILGYFGLGIRSEPTPIIIVATDSGEGTTPPAEKTKPQPAIAFAVWDLLGDEGALIDEVISGSAAEKAGLLKGDIIVTVDNESLSPLNRLTETIQEHNIGDTVVLTVQRGGEELTIQAVLGRREEGGPLLGVIHQAISLENNHAYAVDFNGTALYRFKDHFTGGEWSPDGSKLVFREDNNLLLINAATGQVKKLTDDSSSNFNPSWSPDGQHLAFISDRRGQSFDLYVVDADGKNVRRPTDRTFRSFQSSPTWSPDGSQIAINCAAKSEEDLGGLCIIEVASGQTQVWTPDEIDTIHYAGWSPDNDFFLWPSADIDTILEPKWSPTEDLVAFVGLDSGGRRYGAATYCFVLDLRTSRVEQLTGRLHMVRELEWSPDGDKIAFLGTGTGADRIFTVGRNASYLKVLTFEVDAEFLLGTYCCLDWMNVAPPMTVFSKVVDIASSQPSPEGAAARPSISYDPSDSVIVFDFKDYASLQRALSGADEPIVDIYETSLVKYSGERETSGRSGQIEKTESSTRFTYYYTSNPWSHTDKSDSGFNLKFRALTLSGRIENFWLAIDPSNTHVQVKDFLQIKNIEGVYLLSLP